MPELTDRRWMGEERRKTCESSSRGSNPCSEAGGKYFRTERHRLINSLVTHLQALRGFMRKRIGEIVRQARRGHRPGLGTPRACNVSRHGSLPQAVKADREDTRESRYSGNPHVRFLFERRRVKTGRM